MNLMRTHMPYLPTHKHNICWSLLLPLNSFVTFTPKPLYLFFRFSHRYVTVSDATMNVIFYSISPLVISGLMESYWSVHVYHLWSSYEWIGEVKKRSVHQNHTAPLETASKWAPSPTTEDGSRHKAGLHSHSHCTPSWANCMRLWEASGGSLGTLTSITAV